MKILSKQEVTQQKSIERKTEIDEGVKLAKKIDTLRQTASEEEIKLSKFRDQMLSEIKKDIQSLQDVKSSLIHDVSSLEEKRKMLLIPLDEEWKKLGKRQMQFISEKENFGKLFVQLNEKENELNTREKSLQEDEEQLEELRTTILVKLAHAQEKENEIEVQKRSHEQIASSTLRSLEDKKKELLSFESDLNRRKLELDLQEQKNTKDRQEIINQTILLRDREQTLEREIKRQQNGRV